jgi:putative addiction module killer protein
MPKNEKRPTYVALDNVYVIMHTQPEIKFTVLITEIFDEWISQLSPKLKTLVIARLDRLSGGHFGDYKRFEGLIELRWLNGMRVYGFIHENKIVIALNGGNKNGQDKDIKKAKKIREEILTGTRSISKL